MVEQKLVTLAEQIGRLVGTVQAKAEGWFDRRALNDQIAGIRDGAVDLLGHLAGSEAVAESTGTKREEAAGRQSGRRRPQQGS